MNLFEQASRQKLTFATTKGQMDVQDLWDLSLQQLNTLLKSLNAKIKVEDEDDFLSVASSVDSKLQLRFDIALHILGVKKAEAIAKATSVEKAKERKVLMGVLANIRSEKIGNLSEEEILKRLDTLDV